MPSGKKSKQRRQAARAVPPPVRTKGGPRQRQASPKVLIGAGVAVAAIAVAIVLAVVLGHKSTPLPKTPALGSLANGLPGAAEVDALFKGIPQKGTTLGRASAPVTMTEYVDLQCPYCQEFETQVLPNVVKKFVRAGKLRIDLRPWAFIGPDSDRGQAAVLAASQQNRAFNYAEILYDNQGTENTGWLDENMVAAAAESIPGLHVHTLLVAVSSSSVKALAKQVDNEATADKIDQTPTIYVGKTGTHGKVVNLTSPTDQAAVYSAIEALT